MTRRLIVVRHGRTAWNVEGRFQGRDHPDDPPLDDVGRAQAAAAATGLAGSGATVLLASPLRRAWQTAEAVSHVLGLPVVAEPRLREQGFGHWEGLTRPEVAERFPEQYQRWLDGEEPHRDGGETRAEAGARAAGAVDDVPEGATAVLVTHGAAGAALVAHLLGLGDATRRIGGLHNCHASTLLETTDGWALRTHNVSPASGDSGH